MLSVKTPEEALTILCENFSPVPEKELVPLHLALGRTLYAPICANDYVPGFDRSTVDGYAVKAADTFGCSDSIPAILTLSGEVLMGHEADAALQSECCIAVPTGGAVPQGADAVVMVEYTENYGDGTIGILKAAAPGMNMIYKGDDVFPGKEILSAGRQLAASDIGALAAMGICQVEVSRKPKIGILSTGDELVEITEAPKNGQVRDVNSSMVAALCQEFGAEPVMLGIVKDEEAVLSAFVDKALAVCDAVVLSGGSSVGVKDASVRIIESKGELLLHGLAVKPGKPTILGKTGQKAILGLPGHPVAAFFISHLLLKPLIAQMLGKTLTLKTASAVLTETVGANDGRAQFVGVKLRTENDMLMASPVRAKSGLITALAGADGYFCIPRDCEGYAKGANIQIHFFNCD